MNPDKKEVGPTSDQSDSLRSDYFESLYGRSADGDPWRFAESLYEAAKYKATLDRLPRLRYTSALEVGCSIGVLTKQLADRVDRLLAIDIVFSALDQAKDRCHDCRHVRFELLNVLDAVPSGPFDLIVLSEVAYYWTQTDFEMVFQGLIAQLAPSGQMILVHWRGPVPDYPETGDATHQHAEKLATTAGLVHRGRWVDLEYRTDLWESCGDDFKSGSIS